MIDLEAVKKVLGFQSPISGMMKISYEMFSGLISELEASRAEVESLCRTVDGWKKVCFKVGTLSVPELQAQLTSANQEIAVLQAKLEEARNLVSNYHMDKEEMAEELYKFRAYKPNSETMSSIYQTYIERTDQLAIEREKNKKAVECLKWYSYEYQDWDKGYKAKDCLQEIGVKDE